MEQIFSSMLAGIAALADPAILLLILAGTVFGVIIGALPGLTSTMGVALLVPVTFGMSPASGLALLGAIYCSSTYSGAISAILLNIPGTPANCCTLLDGYPMTKKGESGRAIALATSASAVGGFLSIFALLFLAPPLAEFALRFGAQEYFLLAIFGVSVIASLSERNMLKGLWSGVLGLFLSVIGMHPITGDIRFTGGVAELYNGLSLVIALIGLYSIPEVIASLKSLGGETSQSRSVSSGLVGQMLEVFKYKFLLVKSTVIGIIVGIIPGAGSSIASFVAYDEAKRSSKNQQMFGTGCAEGIIASETSNNAVVGGSLVPALTLGIPGNAVSAVLLGGLMVHGLKPGPALFTENASIVYTFIMSLFVSNIVFVPVGLFIARFCVRLIEIPASILGPLVIGLAVIGSYAINMSMAEVMIMLAIGLIGYLMKFFDVPREPLVLGLVLGSMAEGELARAMSLVHGSVPALFHSMVTSPLSLVIMFFTMLSLWQGVKKQFVKAK
ncbi:tripartite tricarboxylate transporter permease [Cloacibacillus evryensis]|uniref:tripartite tricarboxylate transporter permease n=1 Tax=Cloacibacillus evryensis TaxID=508460 RepID=UPI002109AF7F|nr:tripartite tricarboxylate transporter permease [Cloacibacillus evryensis]MCQ4763920.1 tripartite tricarboxylate transporter permease [Cloacibacillus evryensis]